MTIRRTRRDAVQLRLRLIYRHILPHFQLCWRLAKNIFCGWLNVRGAYVTFRPKKISPFVQLCLTAKSFYFDFRSLINITSSLWRYTDRLFLARYGIGILLTSLFGSQRASSKEEGEQDADAATTGDIADEDAGGGAGGGGPDASCLPQQKKSAKSTRSFI